jgi:hypothetical protein
MDLAAFGFEHWVLLSSLLIGPSGFAFILFPKLVSQIMIFWRLGGL